jgi:hypothetical protein
MTTFNNVIDRAMFLQQDYRLDKLYVNDNASFTMFITQFLLNSIDTFDGVLDSLSYHIEQVEQDEELVDMYVFDRQLTSKEIYILALGISIEWMSNNLLDITQMNLHLSTRDFKAFSEANNLQRKSEVLNAMRENYYKNITDYQLNNISNLPFFGGN